MPRPRVSSLTSKRHVPTSSRVLVALLYGDYTFVRRLSPGAPRLAVKIGPFARQLRISNSRLKDYLCWLHERGLLSYLDFEHGKAELVVAPPKAPTGVAEQP